MEVLNIQFKMAGLANTNYSGDDITLRESTLISLIDDLAGNPGTGAAAAAALDQVMTHSALAADDPEAPLRLLDPLTLKMMFDDIATHAGARRLAFWADVIFANYGVPMEPYLPAGVIARIRKASC